MSKQLPKKIYLSKCDKIAGARIVLKILKTSGVWRNDGVGEKHIIWKNFIIRFCKLCLIHLPATFTFCILMWIEAFNATDWVQAGNILYMALALSVYIVKLCNIWFFSKRAHNYIYDLEYDNSYDLYSQEEINMWQKKQKMFIIMTYIYIGGSFLSAVSAFVGVLFAADYELGYPYWVPFEWRNPQAYWYAYSFNAMGIVVSCLTNTSLDVLGWYMLFHIGLLYKLLDLRIMRLKKVDEKYAVKEFFKFIKLHTHIKRMTTECEILISYYILAQILLSALIICFCGFSLQRLDILANLGQFFGILQFLTVMILEIYLPCYFANEITENSTNLLTTIYDCDWLEFSVKTRKFICLYMEFLKQPVQIRAGNYFEIGLPIFSKVLNNAYGYFTLLLNMAN